MTAETIRAVCAECGCERRITIDRADGWHGEVCAHCKSNRVKPVVGFDPRALRSGGGAPAATGESAGGDARDAVIEAARATVAKVDRLQDALDAAPPVPGQRLLPRDQRESAEHKALRAALRALDAAPSSDTGSPDTDPERK